MINLSACLICLVFGGIIGGFWVGVMRLSKHDQEREYYLNKRMEQDEHGEGL